MRGLRWLEARYRRVLAQLGYEYPPYYMVITESAMVALTIGAAVPRFLAGPQGQQWFWLIAAVTVSVLHMAAATLRGGTVSISAHTAVTIVTAALFWTVYTPYDVVPLLVVLGMTQAAAVTPPRATALHLVAFEALILAAGLLGWIHQAWLIGFTVAFGAAVGRLLQNQLLLLRAEREAQAARISLDRATIAGEVHDVVAHSLAVVLLNVTAARRALAADDDRAEAVEALRDAETQGRAAMNDIRRTIELLRTAGPDAAQPGLADIPELVASFERAGLTVDLDFHSPTPELAGSGGLAAFRVVQESLANAVKHAPGARVDVTVAPDIPQSLAVRVSCPVPAGARRSPGGSGLEGMRARVESAGGTLDAGPAGETWLVSAIFPTEEAR
ncbi:sensor histidine kinase [Tsukamurella paurometabola]|uniref:histidine kinase n=1 Tax=Tsukamurella paurometabola (strain ATCC 8368 / DSM 20162 / CCUG 35730 / CIP 100753 / JCM 10117 / KCTC 9821 / NBRC 16120 / NCIMB 702349 / NCTC 13040) TaxID=521096 RepID=D5UXE7_TSUPD|nr:histidine kinase [Tsukamurella paurometabola]ADG78039.1 integral membrane sensor signal transduction histidine kinase [Tsukamurella paurometabola DSM 20162]SUP29898.1 Nitrate/nitrite sensor protein narX [Tsukamurella paurometabola]